MAIVTFSNDIHILPKLSMLNNGTITINGVEQPVFKVDVVHGEDSDPSKLEFTWQVVKMTSREISIQILFQEAIQVSANEEPDILRLTFIDKYMFVGTNNVPIELEA